MYGQPGSGIVKVATPVSVPSNTVVLKKVNCVADVVTMPRHDPVR
jgi:hypothetical protein